MKVCSQVMQQAAPKLIVPSSFWLSVTVVNVRAHLKNSAKLSRYESVFRAYSKLFLLLALLLLYMG